MCRIQRFVIPREAKESPGTAYDDELPSRRLPRPYGLAMTAVVGRWFIRFAWAIDQHGRRDQGSTLQWISNESRIPYAERKLATSRASPKDDIRPPYHQNELAPGPARYAERIIATSRASPKDVIRPPGYQNVLAPGPAGGYLPKSLPMPPRTSPTWSSLILALMPSMSWLTC